jgi:DNA-binding ferritin-like protein
MGAMQEHATVETEDEDVYGIRDSLEADMEIYGDMIETMRDHIELAQNLGDHATAQIIREILVEVEEDAHHIEHYLEDDSLVLEESVN